MSRAIYKQINPKYESQRYALVQDAQEIISAYPKERK